MRCTTSIVAFRRRDATVAAIFAIALTLRIAWIANTDTTVPPLSDPQFYHVTAQNLADGRGFTVAVTDDHGFATDPDAEATAFWPPGYPFALAPVYAIFGDEERVAKVFNAVIGALTVLPVFFIGSALADHRRGAASGAPTSAIDRRDACGLLAAAIFAMMPAMIFWAPVLFSDTLLAFGVASTFALAMRVRVRRDESDGRGRLSYAGCCAVVGLVLAVMAMVKSQTLVFALPVAVLLVPRLEWRTVLRALAPTAVAGAAVILPWTVRNHIAMGEPYLINDNFCYNLRASHAPYSTGGSVPPQDLWDEQPGISFRERELLFDDTGCGRAWEYAREHPGRELELAPKKIGWLLRSDAADAIEWSRSLGRTPMHRDADGLVLIGDIVWYPMLALALMSPLLLARSRETVALWLALAAWAALHLVFHGEPRYHVAVVPMLIALAAATLMRAVGQLAPGQS
jgi:4-amino-4-deoxy-L-arabinose transferase-like glycosyltransferase